MGENEDTSLRLEVENDDQEIALEIEDSAEGSVDIALEDVYPGLDYITALRRFMAVYARNLSDIESAVETTSATAEEMETTLAELDNVLDNAGLSRWARLNKPNLLKQRWYTNDDHGSVYVYGTAARAYGTDSMLMKSLKEGVVTSYDSLPQDTGIRYWIVTDSTTVYRVVKDEDDIRTYVDTLTGSDIVVESDGETYTKAIRYEITGNSAYGNMEYLICNWGSYGEGSYAVGENPPKEYGNIESMMVGKTYTVSCLARVISGNGALVKFGWGGTHMDWPTQGSYGGCSDFIEVKDSSWQRIHWTFEFTPEGSQFTDSVSGETVTRTVNWTKRVLIGVGRKHTATLQLCGFRLTEGGLELPTKYDSLLRRVEELEERIKELEGE